MNGFLRRSIPTGTPGARTFDVGSGGNYTPVSVTFASVSVAGTLTASATGSDHPNLATSGVDPSRSINRYWTLTPSGLIFTNYNATFTFINGTPVDRDTLNLNGANQNVVRKFNGPSTWSSPTSSTSTATTATATGFTSFSDFAAGNLDATAPTVTGVSSTAANGTYGVGAVIPVTVTFSEAVTVTGTPQLTLETGATDAVVNYSSGSATNTLTFNYTVAAGQNAADLDYVSTTSLALNGGTIRDGASNNATLTLAAPGAANSLGANKDIVIDANAPTVTGVSSTVANATYAAGAVIPVTVTFSEPVNVTGTPQITLETGATDAVVNYSSGSGTSTLTFNYTVAAGETSADLDYVSTTSLALNGGTIQDAQSRTQR